MPPLKLTESTQPVHLLLSEDDQTLRLRITQGLESLGYLVTDVPSGEDALEAVRGARFDLAVFDMNMPGLSGIETAQRIQRETGLPFIMLSGRTDEATVKQALEAGALGYLVKPLDVAQIIPGIEAALRRARDLRELQSAENQLRVALSQTQDISTAIGIIMERKGLSRQAAFDVMRNQARSERRKLADLAITLLQGHSTR